MRLAQPTQPVSRTSAGQEALPAPPEAEVVSYSLQAAEARQRAADRRAELEAAEREAERLEALAEREDRRREQIAEAESLEAQARELERGPIAQLRGRKAVALFGTRSAERRVAKIARSLEHQRQSVTMAEDRLRRAARDADSEALEQLTHHRSGLEQVIAELESALLEARKEAALQQQVIAEAERQLGGYIERTPAYELHQLRKRAELLRSLDGEDEAAVRRREERAALERNQSATARAQAQASEVRAGIAAAERESRIAAWRTGQAWLPGARRSAGTP